MRRWIIMMVMLGIPAAAGAASTEAVSGVVPSTASVPAPTSSTVPTTPPESPPLTLTGPVTLEQILLTPQEIAPACKITSDKRPARNEAQTFFEKGVNSMAMPVIFRKVDQGIECGRTKGVVYYYHYSSPASREEAERGVRSILWSGANQATSRRPEQIFGWDSFLIVVSFKDPLMKDVMAPMIKKLKRFKAATQG